MIKLEFIIEICKIYGNVYNYVEFCSLQFALNTLESNLKKLIYDINEIEEFYSTIEPDLIQSKKIPNIEAIKFELENLL
jgi:hypothetical protein